MTFTTIDTFGQEVRLARAAAHLTQAELAAAVGCSLRTIQNIEAGQLPRPGLRRRLVAFFARQEAITT